MFRLLNSGISSVSTTYVTHTYHIYNPFKKQLKQSSLSYTLFNKISVGQVEIKFLKHFYYNSYFKIIITLYV